MAVGAITYRYPAPTQGNTPPTALQSLNANTVVADLAFGDQATDDDTDIVHNLNLSPADGTLGIPDVSAVPISMGVALSSVKVVYKDKDTITVAKVIKAAGTAATWRFTIKRPHTISR